MANMGAANASTSRVPAASKIPAATALHSAWSMWSGVTHTLLLLADALPAIEAAAELAPDEGVVE